jgi:hypothetical protein
MTDGIDRRLALAVLAASTLNAQGRPDHVTWVAKILERMETIKPGMTRKTLLTVFTTEGGLSTRTQRTYVSQQCPYFKVDVEFKPAAREEQDVILKVSRPYLQFSVID